MEGLKINRRYLLLFIFLTSLIFFSEDKFTQENRDIHSEISVFPYASTAHGKIYIDGNAEMDAFPNKTGAGTLEDPYVIENYSIDAQSVDSCIYIENVNRYLIIRNCTLYDSGTGGYAGVDLRYCSNIQIDDNIISNISLGTSIFYCYNSSISYNRFYNSGHILTDLIHSDYNNFSYNDVYSSNNGLRLRWANNNNITGNNFYSSSYYSIEIKSYSYNNTLSNNSMSGSGLEISRYTSNSIDTSNLVHGKPIYYFEDMINVSIGGGIDIGQIFLCNSSQITIYDVAISNVGTGVYLFESSNNNLTNITVFNTSTNGITGLYSHNNSFSNLKVTNCGSFGLLMDQCTNVSIINCNISNNFYTGILLGNTDDSIVDNNYLCNNSEFGTYINGNNINVSNNYISFNYWGCDVRSSNSTFSNNTISFNIARGATLNFASDNVFYMNSFINNSGLEVGFYGNNFRNKWDNGYVGNYWEDYVEHTGNLLHDGNIWAIPYIENEVEDNFPLVNRPGTLIPMANFSANTTLINLNHNSVQFGITGFEGDIPSEYNWDFGDGSGNSTERNPVHDYEDIGSYNVILTITDSNGDNGTIQRDNFIILENLIPIADFTSNSTVINLSIDNIRFTFNGFEGDIDPTFEWNFGDNSENSSARNPVHEYLSPGSFNITLTIIDVNGDSHTISKPNYIIYENLYPVADFVSDKILIHIVDSSVQFIFTGDHGDRPLYFQWNFGDGSINSSENNPNHIFESFGEYNIALTVIDANGDVDVIVKLNYIIYQNLIPTAFFSSDKNSINVGDLIMFSYEGLGGDLLVSFQWNFGDNSTNSTLRNPSHIFNKSGTYTVILTVTDENGDSHTVIKEGYINVNSDNFQLIIWVVIGSVLLLSIITGSIIYLKKKGKFTELKDKRKEKRSSQIVETVTSMFTNKERLKISEVSNALKITEVEFVNFLIYNKDKIKGIRIEKNEIILSSEETIDSFISILDEQFESWKQKEKSKKGKI